MKYLRVLLILMLIIFIMASFYFKKNRLVDSDFGYILGDGVEYEVLLIGGEGDYGKYVVIRTREDKREVYRRDFSDLNPWKILVGDIDGDGVDDISIGVYKESPLHPVMAKRPFIYSFVGGQIVPKWRGSRLSKPFTDYLFFDIDGDGVDEIVSIEILEEGDNVISSYKWKGFGFEVFLESEAFSFIEDIYIRDNSLYARYGDGGGFSEGIIKILNGNLIIERGK